MTTDLFGPLQTWRLTLTPELLTAISPVGFDEGGWPVLLAHLRQKAKLKEQTLDLTDAELRKVYQYATTGSGGVQQRFRRILSAAWAAGWVQP